jgi:hypothetical protein
MAVNTRCAPKMIAGATIGSAEKDMEYCEFAI